jgi:hypothetical protein
MDYRSRKTEVSEWYVVESQDPLNLRGYLEDLVKVNPLEVQRQVVSKSYSPEIYSSPYQDYRSPSQEILGSVRRPSLSDGAPVSITQPNYFCESCPDKNLHFFIPASRELKLLDIDKVWSPWKSITFKAKLDLPSFFKSIVTPTGDIYLTGGSESTQHPMQTTAVAVRFTGSAMRRTHWSVCAG